MKAIIKQINKIASGYAVIIDIEGKNPMQLEFSENVKKKEIEDKIKDVLLNLKNKEGNLPTLRAQLLNAQIEV